MTSKKMLRIKEWAEEDRPREKMLQKGSAALSDAELLAILIGSGTKEETAVQLAQRILAYSSNNLVALGKLSIEELKSNFKGIGEARAVTITAALELGRRRAAGNGLKRASVGSSNDSHALFYPLLCDLAHEELWVAYLDRSGKVVDKIKVSQGGVSGTVSDIRLILKAGLHSLCSGMILCHNHPSGNLMPSKQDDELTFRLQQAAQLMEMKLLDHLILSDNKYYSYADEGRLY